MILFCSVVCNVCPRQIQRQQPLQNLFIRHVGRVICPAIRRRHGHIQRLVRGGQPGRALVVELGQRTVGQAFLMAVFCDDAVGVRRRGHAERNDFGQFLRPLWRVKPGFAQVVQAFRRLAARAMASAAV
jgi:hypothetical protein